MIRLSLAFLLIAAPALASERVERLIAAMTVEEKIGQLNLETADWAPERQLYLTPEADARLRAGGIGGLFNMHDRAFALRMQTIAVKETRLGVPLLLGYDVVHGYRTIFPLPVGQAASFDLEAIEQAERMAALEALADGVNLTFAPMLDISRDPRWGRSAEGAGESSWWGEQVAAARIRGFQTGGIGAPTSLAACPKHLGANGATLGGLDYTSAEITERELREIHLPPFRAAGKAGAECFMAAFNTFNALPVIANPFLLRQVLRREWRSSALVMSDFGALSELERHGIAADDRQAAHLGLKGGLQMEMATRIFSRELPALARAGQIDLGELDDAARHVLTLKEKMGLFDDPFARFQAANALPALNPPAHREAALRLAEKSLVLLKNEGNSLPFPRAIRRVAVIGPQADKEVEMLGSWYGRGLFSAPVSFAAGLRAVLGAGVALEVVQTAGFEQIAAEEIERGRAAAANADVVILALGESAAMSGEAASRTEIDLPGNQNDLAEAVLAQGKPTAAVLFSGRPLASERLAARAPAILMAWFPGTMGGEALARVLFGLAEPGGRMPMATPRSVGQIPVHHDRLPTGRPPIKWPDLYSSNYLDRPTTPLFPMGRGLSYARFAISAPIMVGNLARVTVSHVQGPTGTAVVQLYLRNRVAPISRPSMMLRGVQRAVLTPGESRTLEFPITPDLLAFWREGDRFEAAPGPIDVMIGFDAGSTQSIRYDYRP
ncbi:MAG: glycoside hydrolase family 3 C-terminal domain-containing protein [Elsteraceae bacterium]